METGSLKSDATELVLEKDRLGGREARLDEAAEERLLSDVSTGNVSDRVLTSDRGRKNDTVLARLNAGLSTLSSSSTCFLAASGSLYSHFPF